MGAAFVAEFILTFMLMWVVMAACDSTKSNQTLVPFAIGMAVFIAHMLALPITGCSINPTRTFASSAAASGLSQCPSAWDNQWLFWVSSVDTIILLTCDHYLPYSHLVFHHYFITLTNRTQSLKIPIMSLCSYDYLIPFFPQFAPILGSSTAAIVYEYCFHDGGHKVDALIDQYLLRKN